MHDFNCGLESRVDNGGNWVIKSHSFMLRGEIHRKYSICTPGVSLVTGHDGRGGSELLV